jgi:hypothetical protein
LPQAAIRVFGTPDQARIDAAVRALVDHPRVREILVAGEHRLLNFALEHEGEDAECGGHTVKRVESCASERFVGTVYDYLENRVLEIRGPLYALDNRVPGSVEVRVLGNQPLPSGEEFAAAVDIVRHERELRQRLDGGEFAAYRPMPPLLDRSLPDGQVERTLTVGLRSTRSEAPFR